MIIGGGVESCRLNIKAGGRGARYQRGVQKVGQGIRDLAIFGSDTASEASVGVEISDTFGFELSNVTIKGFRYGLLLHNKTSWTEGTRCTNVKIEGNKYGITFRRTSAYDSFMGTRFMNVSIGMTDGLNDIGMWFGDTITAGLAVVAYNCIFNVNIWMRTGSTAVRFGDKAVIRASTGLLAGEGTAGVGLCTPVLYDVPGACGFEEGWCGTFKTSPVLENIGSLLYSNRFKKHRKSLNQTGATVKWVKCAVLTSGIQEFTGRVHAQGDGGLNGSRASIIDFSFGYATREATYKPLFVVQGDNGAQTGNFLPVFRVYTVGTEKHIYFKQPVFSRFCSFEFVCDHNEALAFKEFFIETADPVGDGALTLLWDSSVATPGSYQNTYVGRERVQTFLSGSKSYTPPAGLAAGATHTTTTTCTGARIGDFAESSFGANLQGCVLNESVDADDLVTTILTNKTAGAVTLGTATLRVRVSPK
jgi:hypothetical protein